MIYPILIALAATLLAAAWPWLIRHTPVSLAGLLVARFPAMETAQPWIRSVGIPYIAILSGGISAREYGLFGQSADEWAWGSMAAIAMGIAGGWAAARWNVAVDAEWFRAEARWMLYRSAVLLIAPVVWLAALIGGAAGFAERRMEHTADAGQWISFSVRSFCSLVLFFIAHNLYLALFMYAVSLMVSHLLRRRIVARG